MPTEFKVIVLDEALPVVQAALDKQNEYQINAGLPTIKLDNYMQWTVEGVFGISKEQLEERSRQTQLDAITAKISSLPTASLPAVAAAVDAVKP